MVQVTLLRTLASVAISKGTWAVKFCSNKILQVLSGRCHLTLMRFVLYDGCKMVVVVVVIIIIMVVVNNDNSSSVCTPVLVL